MVSDGIAQPHTHTHMHHQPSHTPSGGKERVPYTLHPPRHDTQATEPVQSQLSIQNDLTFDKYNALGNSTFNSSTSVNDQWFLRMHQGYSEPSSE